MLVGLALKSDFPDLHVWSFSPPGALLSPTLHDYCASFTKAVVLWNDFVPRLSVESLERLRDEVVASLACCPLNKNVLLWRSLWGRELRATDVLTQEDQAPAEARATLEKYRASTRLHSLAAYAGRATAPPPASSSLSASASAASLHDQRASAPGVDDAEPATTAPLLPPGPVIALKPVSGSEEPSVTRRSESPAPGTTGRFAPSSRGDHFSMLTWFRPKPRAGGRPIGGVSATSEGSEDERGSLLTGSSSSKQQRYVVEWENARSLVEEGIKLAPSMFSDHMPDYIVDCLDGVVRTGPLMGVAVE